MIRTLLCMLFVLLIAAPARAADSGLDFAAAPAVSAELRTPELPKVLLPRARAYGSGHDRYMAARRNFKLARGLGVSAYILTNVAAFSGGAASYLLVTMGAVATLSAAVVGQIAWSGETKALQTMRGSKPSTGAGAMSLALLFTSFVVAALVPYTGALIGGVMFLGSYVFAEVQNSSSHAFYSKDTYSDRSRGLRVNVAANGLRATF